MWTGWIVQGTDVGGFTNLKQTAKFSLMILGDIFTCCMKFSLSVYSEKVAWKAR
jgi:hypothetical protein